MKMKIDDVDHSGCDSGDGFMMKMKTDDIDYGDFDSGDGS